MRALIDVMSPVVAVERILSGRGDVRQPAFAEADDARPTGHRFEKGSAEALEERWKYQDVVPAYTSGMVWRSRHGNTVSRLPNAGPNRDLIRGATSLGTTNVIDAWGRRCPDGGRTDSSTSDPLRAR